MLTKRKIGVLMGGISAEREISLRSGSAILKALLRLGYNAIGIDTGMKICETIKKEEIEIAFIALHGGWGEDGGIQGLLEVMGIPYTGSGVLASAIGMDKIASKMLFKSYGIPIPAFELMNSVVTPSLDYPLVVKPRKEGSSIGVTIVKEPSQFHEALDIALSYGHGAVAEEYIKGQEVQIGILNNKAIGGVEVRPSLEFYSYEAKYTPGSTAYILPPELDEDTYTQASEIALSAHEAIGAEGATRVDLLINNNNEIFVLEVNTIPGMTETSLLPKIAERAGYPFPALIEEILKSAIERFKVND